MDYAQVGDNEHRRLELYAESRFSSLSKMFREEIQVLMEYEKLICRATIVLGCHPPKDIADRSVRDLYGDVFDSLYVCRQLVLKGYQNTVFPLLRRAFECLSLMEYFMLLPDEVTKWDKGQRISNAEVRTYLDSHPMGEIEEAMKDCYRLFSKGTHPNRDLIPSRFLGEGNEFVLGAVGRPNLVVVWRYVYELIRLWFWFGALLTWHYHEAFRSTDRDYYETYKKISEKAEEVRKRLLAQGDELLRAEESQLNTPHRLPFSGRDGLGT